MKSDTWKKQELSSFCLEFSLLLKAGMPIAACFSILEEEETSAPKKELLQFLAAQTEEGISLLAAMQESGVFPDYVLKMVMMGEETGHLEETFHALSVYYETREQLMQSLKEAVVFPILLLLVMIIVVTLLLVKVLPVFQGVFAQLGASLPPFSMMLLQFGILLQKGKYLFLILLLLFLAVVACSLFSSCGRSSALHHWNAYFHRTKIGQLYARSDFASALSMAVSGGQDLDHSLELAEAFCADSGLEKQISACRSATQEGVSFPDAAAQENLLSPKYCRMLSVGIRTGELDATLSEISRRTAEEATTALSKTIAAVEPVVVILLSLIVGVLLLSVMLPLVGILSSLG